MQLKQSPNPRKLLLFLHMMNNRNQHKSFSSSHSNIRILSLQHKDLSVAHWWGWSRPILPVRNVVIMKDNWIIGRRTRIPNPSSVRAKLSLSLFFIPLYTSFATSYSPGPFVPFNPYSSLLFTPTKGPRDLINFLLAVSSTPPRGRGRVVPTCWRPSPPTLWSDRVTTVAYSALVPPTAAEARQVGPGRTGVYAMAKAIVKDSILCL